MNGKREEMEEEEEMKKEVENGGKKEKVVLMWGYLPGVSRQRSPVFSPTEVSESSAGDSWRDVCGGGCGFAMAVSESGKLYTWGSTDDMGQSYVAAGKHEEIPEAFPLPGEVSIVKAAAGWAHCAAVTASGEVYTWGWKECVPSGKAIGDQLMVGIPEKDDKQSGSFNDQGACGGIVPSLESNKAGEESTKRRRLSSAKRAPESSTSSEEALSAPPCLVTFDAGVRITAVAAGGRHTLALSGFRCRSAAYGKDRSSAPTKANANSEGQACKVVGSCVKAIACGGRHSAVITDSGAILTFGWGLYGQCGQGSTDDELSPKCVSSLLGVKMQGVAAGLWHTVCISTDGDVYSFGGNQFGQLGTGSDQAEAVPKLLEGQCLEDKKATVVSCGARHSAIITEDGDAICWGWNKYGQLGLGDSIDRSIPTHLPIERFLLTNVSCGWWHTLMLAESPTRS